MPNNTTPCADTACGSYDPTERNNCRHDFKDHKTFTCLGFIAGDDPTEKMIDIMDCVDSPMPKHGDKK